MSGLIPFSCLNAWICWIHCIFTCYTILCVVRTCDQVPITQGCSNFFFCISLVYNVPILLDYTLHFNFTAIIFCTGCELLCSGGGKLEHWLQAQFFSGFGNSLGMRKWNCCSCAFSRYLQCSRFKKVLVRWSSEFLGNKGSGINAVSVPFIVSNGHCYGSVLNGTSTSNCGTFLGRF